MTGAILPLPNTPSWRDAQLKNAQGQIYLYLYLYLYLSTSRALYKYQEIKIKKL
jgi:hypothetical protein